uniref:Transglutaminase-like domain-containing protein n=1 Tax=Periophthalmus magnuspinnatus TaxID=409849 RepID=A0A3B4ACJ2_9GOBI
LPEFEPFDHADATPRANPGSPLVVQDVDLSKSMNIANHHTGMYITETLVVRRGDPIFLKLTFNRPVTAQDNFQVQFRIGQSTFSKVSSILFSGLVASGPWEASASEQQGALMLQVTPAPNAVVGRYRVVVAVALANGLQYTGPELQPSDTAFLESGHEEYVMNDSGVIWIGSLNSEYPRPWNYGQFEQGVLEACIYIMDKSQLPISDRGDPVKVVRMASAMINSQDDNGVLVGNWSEDFSMGKSPMFWTGSVQILQQYHSTGVPVSYAQCWVYAGVLNTFMRCLGLASRVITNFLSAHDNDGNLKTDLIFTSDMQPDSRHTRDSIWNYHCWNEVYLRRMDIPEEFSGWQVIDSTPQETSDGNYRCGPASVKAIKIGKVCFPFDGRFIFAEVNSDVLYHTRDRYGKLSLQKVDKKLIGQKLVTKSPHGNYQLDITLEYKYNEGKTWFSPSSVLRLGMSRDIYRLCIYHVSYLSPQGYVGRPLEAQLDIVNPSGSLLQTQVLVFVETTYYTGVRSHEVHKENYNLDLPANSSKTHNILTKKGHLTHREGT